MMMMQDRNNLNINDIDLSLLRLSSPPYDYSRSAVSPEISPLKRSSPVSEESDQSKRRRISPQNPIFITSPPPQSSTIDDPTPYPNLTAASPVSEKHETSPSAFKTPDKETMKMVNDHNREETNCDVYEEINRQETNYNAYEEINRQEADYNAYEDHQQEEKEEEEEEDCGEGMRIERSGDGFVIRLKCRCNLAFRVLFSDHHLYFKRL